VSLLGLVVATISHDGATVLSLSSTSGDLAAVVVLEKNDASEDVMA
jgi:hypothetical protein